MIDGAQRHASPGWRCACPRTGRREDKVGRHFAEVHAPVADNALLLAAGDHLVRLVTGAERWERFVWTVTPASAPARAPGARRPRTAGRPTPMPTRWPRTPGGAPSARPSSRCPSSGQAVFTIHVESAAAGRRGRQRPRTRGRLHDAHRQHERRRCWPTAACAGVRDAAAGLAGARAGAGRMKTAPIVAGAHRLRRPTAALRAALRRRLPPARRRARAGAACLPGRQRPARSAGPGAQRFVDRSRPASAWATTSSPPGHAWRARPGALRAPALRLDREAPAGAGRPGARCAARRRAPALAAAAGRGLAAAHAQPAPLRLRRRPRAAAAGAAATWRPGCRELVARVDAFYLDGFAPARNPRDVGAAAVQGARAAGRARRHGRHLERGARGARRPARRPASRCRAAPGSGGKRDITVGALLRRASRRAGAARPRRAGARRRAPCAGRRRRPGRLRDAPRRWPSRAGAAPCSTATPSRPARPRATRPACSTASCMRDDGAHARCHRAAALACAHGCAPRDGRDGVPGAVDGLLRLARELADAEPWRALLAAAGPAGRLRAGARRRRRRARRAGLPLSGPAWFYPGRRLGRAARAWSALVPAPHGAVSRVAGRRRRRATAARADGWQAARRRTAACSPRRPTRGAGQRRRRAAPARRAGATGRCEAIRGQVSSRARPPALRAAAPAGGRLRATCCPPLGGRPVFGATRSPDDWTATVRDADHRHNLDALPRLTGRRRRRRERPALHGPCRLALQRDDRLPLVGAVPDDACAGSRLRARPAALRAAPAGAVRVHRAGLARHRRGGAGGAPAGGLGDRRAARRWRPSLLDAVDPARFAARGAAQGAQFEPGAGCGRRDAPRRLQPPADSPSPGCAAGLAVGLLARPSLPSSSSSASSRWRFSNE